jgi:hypothetical protein
MFFPAYVVYVVLNGRIFECLCLTQPLWREANFKNYCMGAYRSSFLWWFQIVVLVSIC